METTEEYNPDNIDLMLEGTDKEIYDLNRLREQHEREIKRIDDKIGKLCLTQMEKLNETF